MLRKRDCRHIEPLLWEYAEGRLSEGKEAQVGAHLSQCASCRMQSTAYRQTVEGLAAIKGCPLPASLRNWRDVRDALVSAPLPSGAARRGAVSARPVLALPRITWTGAGAFAAVCGLLMIVQTTLQEPAPTVALWTSVKSGTPLVSASPGKISAAWPAIALLKIEAVKHDFRIKTATLWSGDSTERQRKQARSFVRTTHSVIKTVVWSTRRTKRRQWLLAADKPAANQHPDLVEDTGGIQDNAAGMLAQNFGNPNRQTAFEPPQESPDYVLTVVEDTTASPRDYVMDGVSADTVRAPQDSSNSTMKEIRAW